MIGVLLRDVLFFERDRFAPMLIFGGGDAAVEHDLALLLNFQSSREQFFEIAPPRLQADRRQRTGMIVRRRRGGDEVELRRGDAFCGSRRNAGTQFRAAVRAVRMGRRHV
ncbi:MAG: hypothetical protein QM811_27255 [Pirellulales bacterium]